MKRNDLWKLYRTIFVILAGIVAVSLIDHFVIQPRKIGGTPELLLGSSYPASVFHALCVSLTLILGIGLYFVRCRRPALYGQLEIFSGLGAALFASNQLTAGIITGALAPTSTAAAAFAELAALYVIVRGFGNIHLSLTGKSKEVWERFFFAQTFLPVSGPDEAERHARQ